MSELRYRLEIFGGHPPTWKPYGFCSTDDFVEAKESADYLQGEDWQGVRIIDGKTGDVVHLFEGTKH